MGILETVNRLFSGIRDHAVKLDIMTALRMLMELEPTDQEYQQHLQELCENIVLFLRQHGKDYTIEQCKDDLTQAIAEERSRIAARMLVSKMIRRRRRKTETGTETEIL